MNTAQITQLTKALTNNKQAFLGTFPRDHMPQIITKRPCAFVVNTDSCHGPGEHWNAILLLPGGEAEFFNSFGFPPLHGDEQAYLRKHANEFTFSGITLQDPLSDRCGLFCVDYILSRLQGESFSRFVARYLNRRLPLNEKVLEKRILNYHPKLVAKRKVNNVRKLARRKLDNNNKHRRL